MSEQRLIDANALDKKLDKVQEDFVSSDDKQWERNVGIFKGLARARQEVKDAKTISAVPVVRCKECKHRESPYACPMRKLVMPVEGPGAYEDCTEDEGYCHKGERMNACGV